MSILLIAISDLNLLSTLGVFAVICTIFTFYFSSLIFLRGYDLWSDYSTAIIRAKLSKSDAGVRFELLIKNLNSQLGLLI